MKVEFKERFAKDLKSVKDKSLLKRAKEVIELVEQANSLADIPNLKKLKGGGSYFRLRVGIIDSVSLLRMILLSLSAFWIEKLYTNTSHKKREI